MNASDIFISYSRKNLQAVMKLKEEIEVATHASCWMDLEGIESGPRVFTKAIINAINSCPIFLFMLSEESQKSENALKELDFAYKKYREDGKKVVIVYIEACLMTDEFCFDYGKADTIDWQDEMQREKLIRDICRWTGSNEQQVTNDEVHDTHTRGTSGKATVTLNIKRNLRYGAAALPFPILLNNKKLSRIFTGQSLSFEIPREPAILTVDFGRIFSLRNKTIKEVKLVPKANTHSIECTINLNFSIVGTMSAGLLKDVGDAEILVEYR